MSYYTHQNDRENLTSQSMTNPYCPYCGTMLEDKLDICQKCRKSIE
jgi:tRNA(Ile2) C34 agmatinyltransferase TiaS